MAGIDVNRTTEGVRLDPAVASEIWSAAEYTSAAMQLAPKIPLPGSGVTVDIITGEPEAEWVAETDEKPVSRPTFDSKLMTPYKLAVIVPVSNEFRRDKARLYGEVVRKLPQALGKKFDRTVFGDVPAPGENFDKLSGAEAVDLSADPYQGLVAADAGIAEDGGILDGWALAPQGRGLILGAVDGFGRPLFLPDTTSTNAIASLLGSPVYQAKGVYLAPNQIGFGGDWSSSAWGSVEGISIAVADQATINDGGELLHLWQRNMFAIRAEVEVGFRVRDIAHFRKLLRSTSGS